MLSYKIYIPWHSIRFKKKGPKKQKTQNNNNKKKKTPQNNKQTQINKTQIHVTMNMMGLLYFSKKKEKKNEQYE